jgi:hypothetical protein
MTTRALIATLSLLLPALVAPPARAEPPSLTVRGFFAALEQHDFGGALARTDGAAARVIGELLAAIDREARSRNAQVSLRVRSLRVQERAAVTSGPVPVDVTYDIDIIGRRWIFSRVARRLSGSASFLVDARRPCIVAVVGELR